MNSKFEKQERIARRLGLILMFIGITIISLMLYLPTSDFICEIVNFNSFLNPIFMGFCSLSALAVIIILIKKLSKENETELGIILKAGALGVVSIIFEAFVMTLMEAINHKLFNGYCLGKLLMLIAKNVYNMPISYAIDFWGIIIIIWGIAVIIMSRNDY